MVQIRTSLPVRSPCRVTIVCICLEKRLGEKFDVLHGVDGGKAESSLCQNLNPATQSVLRSLIVEEAAMRGSQTWS